MVAVLIQIDAWDPVAGAAVVLRAANIDDDRLCHLNGAAWFPAIAKAPVLRYDLFDGSFSGNITSPQSALSLAIEPWPNLTRYALADARIQIWTGAVGDAWPAFTRRFDGRVISQPAVADGIANITFGVDDKWLDSSLLTTYAGTSGAEGDGSLKGQPKPLSIGAPRFVPGQMTDSINTVVQVSGYGAIEDVEVAFERAARFGASSGDYASLDALVAAAIPAGSWGTCKAAGFVRHGAPPTGKLCYHVKGDKAGPDGWVRLPGSSIRRLALLAGGAGKTDDASLAALNASRPYTLSIYQGDQITAREMIQRVAASVNAVAGVSWLGKLFVAPVGFSAPVATLDASGAALPPVAKVEQVEIDAPYWRLALGAQPTWLVHDVSEIAFTATLLELGAYNPATTYREGNIVNLGDGSRWLYTATAPTAGNMPAAGSAFWSILSDRTVPITGRLTSEAHVLTAAADGTVVSYDGAGGAFQIFDGTTDVSANFTLSTVANPHNLTITYAAQAYSVVAGFDPGEPSAVVTIRATGTGAYADLFIDKVFSLAKAISGDSAEALAAAAAAAALAASKARVFFGTSFPLAADSSEDDIFINEADGYKRYKRLAGDGVVSIGGSPVTIGGQSLGEYAWVPADPPAIANFNARNDRISSAVLAPVVATDGTAVDHTLNTDGSANISFEWSWAGDEATIDGHVAVVHASTSSQPYVFGSDPQSEVAFPVPADRRAIFLHGAPADMYFSFAVYSYRDVDPDIALSQRISSATIAASAASEAPYQPSSNIAFSGDITGTIQGRDSLAIIGTIEAIASDAVLSAAEKPQLKREYSDYLANWAAVDAKATALGGFAEQAAAAAAKTTLVNGLTALSPGWNITTADTPIDRDAFQNWWDNAYSTLAALAAALQGQAGITGLLSNESVTLPADAAGNITSYSGAAGVFKVFAGKADVSASFTLTTASNPQNLTVNYVGQSYTVTAGYDAAEDAATLTIRATGSGAYANVQLDKVLSLSKSKSGAAAKLLFLTSDRQTISYDGTGALSPAAQTTTFTVNRQNSAVVPSWSVTRTDGTAVPTAGLLTIAGDGLSATMTAAAFGAARATANGLIVSASITDGVTVADRISVVAIKGGADGTSPLAITLVPAIASIQLDSSGVAVSGQLPLDFGIIAKIAGATAAITAVTITSSSGGTWAVSGTNIRLSAVPAGSSGGQCVFTVTAGGQTVTGNIATYSTTQLPTQTAQLTKNWTPTVSEANSAAFVQTGTTLATNARADGTLSVNLGGGIKPSTAGYQFTSKLQVSTNGGSTWTDVAGSLHDSTVSDDISGGEPGVPSGIIKAFVNGSGPYLLSGLGASAAVVIRAMIQKKAGAIATASTASQLQLFADAS